MLKIIKISLAIILLRSLAIAADPALMSLVMPDAKVIAGIQVDQTKNSLFGQFVLSHMQPSDPSFQKFIAESGFDPRRGNGPGGGRRNLN